MKKIQSFQAESMLSATKRRGRLRRTIALLSAFVMLFTMNSLKFSADTLERIPMCGYEYDHVHGPECFDENGLLTCALHEHTDACYQERPVHVEATEVEAPVEEVEAELGGEAAPAPEEQPSEQSAVEEAPADEAPAENAFDLNGLSTVKLGEIIEAAKLPVSLADVEQVGMVDDAQREWVGITFADGDFDIAVQRDFDEAELGIVVGNEVYTVMLTNGAAATAEQQLTDVWTTPESEDAEAATVAEDEAEAAIEADDEATTEAEVETEAEGDAEAGDETATEENTEAVAEGEQQLAEAWTSPVPEEGEAAPEAEDDAEVENVTDAENNAEEVTDTENDTEIENVTDAENGTEEATTADNNTEVENVTEENAEAVTEDEQPAETEEIVETEQPAEAEEVVETEEPAETEENVETEQPAETEEIVEIEQPVEAEENTEAEQPAEAEEVAEDEQPAEAEENTEDEQPAAVEFHAGERENRINDCTVLLSWGAEAEIPDDVQVEIREIELGSDEYEALYADALERLPEADADSTQVMRFFDITLYTDYNNRKEKVEPKAAVSVEVRVDEVVESDVTAIHYGEEETTLVDATAEGQTVTFEADSFSIYGVAYSKDAEQRSMSTRVQVDLTTVDQMDAATVTGDTVTLSLSELLAGADADVTVRGELGVDGETFVADAEVTTASDVTVEDGAITLDAEALARGSVTLEMKTREVDEEHTTTVVTHTATIELADYPGRTDEVSGEGVTVAPVNSEQTTLPGNTTASAEAVAVPEGIIDEAENAVVDAVTFDITLTDGKGEAIPEPGLMEVTVTPANVNIYDKLPEGAVPGQVSYTLFHSHEGQEPVELPIDPEDVIVDAEGNITEFKFQTSSFSEFTLKYTVDFEYNGYNWSFPGLGSYSIASIMEEIGVEGEITHVSLKLVEGEEVEGALYLEEKEDGWYLTSDIAFDDTYELTVVVDGAAYVITVTDAQATLTTFVKFFAKDAEIIKEGADPNYPQPHINGNQEAPNDPALASRYYVLAILKDNADHELGWAIQDIGTPTENTVQTNFSTFNRFETQSETETAEDYQARRGQSTTDTVNYDTDNKVTVRLFRADNALSTVNYQELVTKHAANKTYDSPEDGYEFGGSFVKDNKTEAEIHLKKANNKKYKVRIYLDENAKDDIAASDNYYLYLKVNHASGDPSHYYVKLDISAATVKGNYVEFEFPHWMDNNGNVKTATSTNNTFTGNERGIEVKLLKYDGDFKPNNYTNATVNEEGSAIKAYKVHYDTAATNPKTSTTTHYYEEEETVDGKTVVNCIDKVELQTIDAEGKYNYASILGPNLNYGIVADHLYHENHMQTNFAVNHYTGHGHDARPDLSGTSGGQIVIGEYNKIVSDFWLNGPVNGVGEAVTTVDIAGQLKIGDPLSATLVVYADEDSGSPGDLGTDDAKVRGNLNQTVVIQTDGAELSANIVEPALHYMDRMSAELASHPATFDPPIPGNGKLTIDTKAFPDDATIFINADRIRKFIASSGDLIIDKKPNQTIIFNFNKDYGKTEQDNIMLAQFVVKQDVFPENGYTTSSPVGTGDPANVYMDAIARHIVWNLNGVHGKTTIDISGGIYLQPNEDSVIDVKGTTAGWIVSEGLVSNGSGEWHNVFAEMPDTSSVKLDAYKTVDSIQPRASQKFNFFLDEYDTSVDGNWKTINHNVQNTTGSVSFPEIKNLTTGWHVYRITEDQVKPSDTNGYFIMDGDTYYAVVNVKTITTAGGQAATIVTPPVYYRNFDPSTFDRNSETLTGFSNTDKVGTVTFDNEEITDGLNILKKVQGTTANDIEFTFKVELWFEDTGSVQPYVKTNDTAASFDMTTAAGPAKFTLDANNNEGNHSVGFVTLKAGELVNIQGIDDKAHYRITETMVNGQPIEDGETYVNGYKRLTAEQTGDMSTGLARAVFENEYKAFGTLDLKAHKALIDNTGKNKQLGENMFAFRLAGHNAVNPTEWIWNDANGKVTFPTINYSSADMEDAVPDPSNGNKLTKTLTYTVHENHELGTGANNLAAQNVTYDDDKTVTVTLVDNGDGTITATASIDGGPLTDLTVEFNNTYEYQVPKGFEGTKVLTGRDMADQEFWFNAVLTKYSDGTTETTYADDTEREAVDFVSATKVEGTNWANGNILFPVITFKKAGSYTFTVTEDETRLPDDVEPTTPGQSYDVTIVVTEGMDSTTNEKILVAGEPIYTNNKTINNTQKKMGFTVTKEWLNAEGTEVFDGHTITFSVTKDGVAFPVTAEHIEKVGTSTTDGSYTVNSDGTVTLTAGAEAWPTVRLKELDYPTTGYAVSETAHTGEAEGNFVNTTYRLNAGDYQAASPAVKVNDDALKIKNNETNTGLHVTKKWVASDGETDISKTVDADTVYFKLYCSYNNGGNVGAAGKTIYQITKDTDGKWSTFSFDGLSSDPWNWGTFDGYYIVETDSKGNPLPDQSLITYTMNGKEISQTNTFAADANGLLTITNKVKPTGIQVVKKWVGPKTDSVQVELWRSPMSGGSVSPTSGEGKIPLKVKIGGGEETTIGYIDKGVTLTITRSAESRENTWTPSTSVYHGQRHVYQYHTADNEEQTDIGQNSSSSALTLVVLEDTSEIQWNYVRIHFEEYNTNNVSYEVNVSGGGSDSDAEVDHSQDQIVEGEGITNPVTLNASNSWFYEWTNLESGYLYFVKEQNTDGYVTTYTNNDGIKKGLITVTNTYDEVKSGNLKITKTTDPTTSTEAFDFTIQFSGEGLNDVKNKTFAAEGKANSVDVDSDGKATVSLKNSEYVLIKGLPAGVTYTVTEGDKVGWTNTVKTNDTGTIEADQTKEASFTNEQLGKLKLKKEFKLDETQTGPDPTTTNALVNALDDGEFTFTVKGPVQGPGASADTVATVVIMVKNGVATQYKLNDADWTDLPTDKYVTIPDLAQGDYVITEAVDSKDPASSVSAITGGVSDTANLQQRTVTAHVTAGDRIEKEAKVSYTNQRKIDWEYGAINLVKTDNNWNPIGDATFELRKSADSNTPIKVYSIGATRVTISTEDDAIKSYLPTGDDASNNKVTLYLVETKAPDGYKLPTVTYPVVITREKNVTGDMTKVTYSISIGGLKPAVDIADQPAQAIPNTPVGEITVTKYVKEGTTDSNILNDKTITIGLFKGDEEPAANAGPDRTEVLTITNNTGTVTFRELDLGNYWVYELDANYHPVKSGGTITIDGHIFKVEEDATKVVLNEAGPNGSVVITNKLSQADISIVKVDSEVATKKLTGAKFKILRRDLGSEESVRYTVFDNDSANFAMEGTTNTGITTVDDDGKITLSGLLPGEYEVSEEKAPDGYIITQKTFYFTVNADGTVTYADGSNGLVTYDETNKEFVVGNTPGARLPSTGGMGTGLIYATGTGLLLLAVIAWVMKAKKRDYGAY